MKTEDSYRYTAHWSEEDGEWVGRCGAFPSLSWLAPGRDEALAGIRDLVAEGVAALEARGIEAPKATAAATPRLRGG